MNNPNIEKYVRRKINRVAMHVDITKDYNANDHTFHGGWEKGYYQGKLSVLEDILDMIDEMHEEEAAAAQFRSELIERMKEK